MEQQWQQQMKQWNKEKNERRHGWHSHQSPSAAPACSRSRCRAASKYSSSGGRPLPAWPRMICRGRGRDDCERGGAAAAAWRESPYE